MERLRPACTLAICPVPGKSHGDGTCRLRSEQCDRNGAADYAPFHPLSPKGPGKQMKKERMGLRGTLIREEWQA